MSLELDAARYRLLRSLTWDASPLCVVANPLISVKLGHDCPSHERLDGMLDVLAGRAEACGTPQEADA